MVYGGRLDIFIKANEYRAAVNVVLYGMTLKFLLGPFVIRNSE